MCQLTGILSVMTQNFRQINLRGRSFKGQNLSKADFSYSDIRGADFTDANLTDANFSHAKAGLQPHWAIGLVILSILLSALSGFTSATLSFRAAIYFLPRIPNLFVPSLVAGVVVLIVYVVFCILTVRQGIAGAILSVGVAGAVASVVHVAVIANVGTAVDASGVVGKAIAMTVGGGMAGATAVVTAGVVAGVMAGAMAAAGAVAGVGAVVGTGVLAVAVSIVTARITAVATAVAKPEAVEAPVTGAVSAAAATAVTVLCIYVSWRVLAGDEKHAFVRTIAVAIAATGGTRFRSANLTNANFNYATLKSTDFRRATITRTCWYKAIKLDWARVGDTILTNSAVRNLLISRNGYQKSYEGANLRGANLMSADLSHANLKTADLSEATLQTACLDWANLTQVQAIGTDFTDAQLTGACLEAWNIDSTTQLKGVESKFVYLLENPKPGTDDRERRPSSGEFASGEFTKLFQEALNTVDLIFRSGINWKALVSSFKQVQVQNEGIELAIQSIENKGDGVVVVKVSVPSDANKGKIHSDFMQLYEESLKALEEKYQAEVRGREELLERYHQQSADMLSVIKHLAARPIPIPPTQTLSDKLVVLSFGNGDFEKGFAAVTAQIWSDGHSLPVTFTGRLPPKPEISALYQQWYRNYENLRFCYQVQGWFSRIKPKLDVVRQVSIKDINQLKQEIQYLANNLKNQLNIWLSSESFSSIKNKLQTKLNPCDRIQFIIQSDDIQMRRIPWHLWEFFEDYRKAEVALSASAGDRVTKKSVSARTQVRILAILGNSQGINLDEDQRSLKSLPQAETVFLVEPTRKEFDEALWDERGWNILCFSGHSSSKWDGINGWIDINQTDRLTIDQLENALKAAIERGLHLAIFNSCNGLGLARKLDTLHIPQIIVMREPVPDLVAQEFLKNFLTSFSSGKSLYVSVREAREKLQSMEDDFPCASWLPTICQNQAEIPQTWREFMDAQPNIEELLTRLEAAIATDNDLTTEDKDEALAQVNILAHARQNPEEEATQVRAAIRMLRGIIAERPTATQMAEAFNKLLLTYFAIKGDRE